MIEYRQVLGEDVPRKARILARRQGGNMRYWYDNYKSRMRATLLIKDGKLIGWCAAVRDQFWFFNTKDWTISTYVQRDYRGKGYGRKLLDRTTKMIRLIEPQSQVHYGTPDDHIYFDDTYKKTIVSNKLKANNYFGR